MRKVKSSNPQLLTIINFLKKKSKDDNVRIWRSIANHLSKTRSRKVSVNLSRINRHTEKDQIVAVPGKVLGAGKLEHPVTIAAFQFSVKAIEKIKSSKGKCLTFSELVKKNPKGSKVKIVG
jgi:large subunit ribosomal protein L18e